MPFNGRQLTFDWSATTLAGVRSRSLNMSNEYVDVTTDDSTGWRTLLSDPGLRSIEVTISGITEDEVLIAAMQAASVASDTLQADLPSSLTTPGNISGSYLVSSLELSGDHDGAYEFSATFMSTGAITYTASTA